MLRQAFYNNDGDSLILRQNGSLDVQTEPRRIMTRSDELFVIQVGISFKVTLPDGPVRGHLQESLGITKSGLNLFRLA